MEDYLAERKGDKNTSLNLEMGRESSWQEQYLCEKVRATAESRKNEFSAEEAGQREGRQTRKASLEKE